MQWNFQSEPFLLMDSTPISCHHINIMNIPSLQKTALCFFSNKLSPKALLISPKATLEIYFCVYGRFACMCVCATHVCSACGGQKRALDPLELELGGCKLSCVCWQLNPDPLEKQFVLLTTETSLQSLLFERGFHVAQISQT